MPKVIQGPGGSGGASQGIATVLSFYRDKEVRSATSVVDVEVIQFETIPHGVYCERNVPYLSFQENGYDPLIAPVAEAIEYALQNGFASYAVFLQDVGNNGLIVNQMEFGVQVDGPPDNPGPFTSNVVVTVQQLYDGTAPIPQIEALQAQIKLAAGL